MDLQLSNPSPKTPAEPEPETQTRILPVKPLSFTNGVLKRHPPLHHPHPIVVTYKECLKNHAANMGAHALDGCGEFMPSPTTNPTDPTSLKCAACGCHRNFHRREPDAPQQQTLTPTPALEYHPQHRHHPLPPPRGDSGSSDNNSPSPPPISSTYYPSVPHVLLSLSHNLSAVGPSGDIGSNSSSRKRHRTRFSHEQKKRMMEFSERLGWKMQKRDEDAINGFCGEIGVDRGVFKVWMHNNKNNYGKKQDHHHQEYPLLTGIDHTVVSTPPAEAAATVNGNGLDYGKENAHERETNQHHLFDNGGVQVPGTNGSSSS